MLDTGKFTLQHQMLYFVLQCHVNKPEESFPVLSSPQKHCLKTLFVMYCGQLRRTTLTLAAVFQGKLDHQTFMTIIQCILLG
jgi:hypothetical protein